MPVDARAPLQPPMPPKVTYRRHYRDAALRPLDGVVTLTPADRTATRHVVVVPAPVLVDLVRGELIVDLVPGSYTLRAELRSPGGGFTVDEDTVDVVSPAQNT
jgi:hypothetical protein